MTALLTWSKGGEAELVELEGDRVRLRSTTPSAPGARPDGALRSTGTAIRLKVARCRLLGSHERGDLTAERRHETAGHLHEAERLYEIEGRLIDATREVRAELAQLIVGDRTE